MTQEALFDMEALAREAVAAKPWHGAPLAYTEDYYSPDELAAAYERYIAEHGRFACLINSHMWTAVETAPGGMCVPPLIFGHHRMVMVHAYVRCEVSTHDHRAAPLPSGVASRYQPICEPCRWHAIVDDENAAVEAWHDHAMPGWRDLPVRPSKPKQVAAWLEAYPADWQLAGCPVLTWRDNGAARHVPRRSPWGGYDLGVPAPGKAHS